MLTKMWLLGICVIVDPVCYYFQVDVKGCWGGGDSSRGEAVGFEAISWVNTQGFLWGKILF